MKKKISQDKKLCCLSKLSIDGKDYRASGMKCSFVRNRDVDVDDNTDKDQKNF